MSNGASRARSSARLSSDDRPARSRTRRVRIPDAHPLRATEALPFHGSFPADPDHRRPGDVHPVDRPKGGLAEYFPAAPAGFVVMMRNDSDHDLTSLHALCRIDAKGGTLAVLAEPLAPCSQRTVALRGLRPPRGFLILAIPIMTPTPRREIYPDDEGPLKAALKYLEAGGPFEIDRGPEKYLLTFFPMGFLRRVRDAP